ncbi:Glutamyl-tRNA(Gln) amidotransferase subunit A [Pseudoruegeria aquimaris]|uniref:Glutamyl-tRNA(Gln) amidotransferase subunit A n=1 Tax=Pseudoruegeria aquimaris TaxID=393663 RepID=A0A1Y5TRW0_9RHOB|nr:amidase family protein [Pseudoruegeria aquimaris]SLN66773.1 Glutamyl-tRNA(Gln) amidotransferase subunit A [Pseudoruegeria aquimaris]
MAPAWLKQSASELGRGIAAGRICPVDLAEAHLEAIKAHPIAHRIYARTTPKRARAEAMAARARVKADQRLGPLDGVPLSWKDLFDTAGVATEAGSALLKGRVPAKDAEVLRNATAAGLVCLGKTHMSELAFSGLGYNPITETPPCINDEGAVSGGSSSGAAASVAFGLAPAGIGSDTGGSVRIPAAWNDLVGLKTTLGRLPVTGTVPLCAQFDTIGPLCRSVEDAARLLGVLGGSAAPDLTGASASGLRLAVLETAAFDDIREAPAEGFAAARRRLERAGAEIDPLVLPEVGEALSLSAILFATEAYGLWKARIEAAPEKMFPEILERFRGGSGFSGADYVAAWARLRKLRAAYLRKTAGYDAVILPTSPILPPNLERLGSDHGYYVTENLMALRNTRIGNLMGLCGLTLPTGTPSCGMMILAAPMQEERLLRIGAACEAALT